MQDLAVKSLAMRVAAFAERLLELSADSDPDFVADALTDRADELHGIANELLRTADLLSPLK